MTTIIGQYKTRNGLMANVLSMSNRFGQRAVMVVEREFHTNPVTGKSEMGPVDKLVYVDKDGRCASNPQYDAKLVEQREDIERVTLAKRRMKDNWL